MAWLVGLPLSSPQLDQGDVPIPVPLAHTNSLCNATTPPWSLSSQAVSASLLLRRFPAAATRRLFCTNLFNDQEDTVGTPYPAAVQVCHWNSLRHSLSTGKTCPESLTTTPAQPASHVGWPPPWEVAPSYNLPDPDLGEAKSRLVWWTVWTPRPPTYTGDGRTSIRARASPACLSLRQHATKQVKSPNYLAQWSWNASKLALCLSHSRSHPRCCLTTPPYWYSLQRLVFRPTQRSPPLIRTAPGRDNAYTSHGAAVLTLSVASSASMSSQLHTLKHMDHDDRIYRVSAFIKPGKSLSPPVGASMATPSAPASATPLKLKAFSQLGRRPVRVVNHTPIDAPCGKSKQRLFAIVTMLEHLGTWLVVNTGTLKTGPPRRATFVPRAIPGFRLRTPPLSVHTLTSTTPSSSHSLQPSKRDQIWRYGSTIPILSRLPRHGASSIVSIYMILYPAQLARQSFHSTGALFWSMILIDPYPFPLDLRPLTKDFLCQTQSTTRLFKGTAPQPTSTHFSLQPPWTLRNRPVCKSAVIYNYLLGDTAASDAWEPFKFGRWFQSLRRNEPRTDLRQSLSPSLLHSRLALTLILSSATLLDTRKAVDAAAEAHPHIPLVAYVQQRHFITRKPLLGLGQGHQTQAYPRRTTTWHHTASEVHRRRYLYLC
ncbi:uncharacterized protein CLUP02_11311 [Colletotrichum lupini]|uniref:Uncharacterized protein n=1 Tax=Colletotrichum lupini TaxID=145971 RepID=A0A9Q8SYE6_9PEZI|nr:uncharacterized protein CLUP02_11311 [Colletotrichum lupini]UQC85812.1 hypothetical protein CLUP02_11311 [Colletotrichum lupini]